MFTKAEIQNTILDLERRYNNNQKYLVSRDVFLQRLAKHYAPQEWERLPPGQELSLQPDAVDAYMYLLFFKNLGI